MGSHTEKKILFSGFVGGKIELIISDRLVNSTVSQYYGLPIQKQF